MATEWKARMGGILNYYLVGSWIFVAGMVVLWLWLRIHPPSAVASLSPVHSPASNRCDHCRRSRSF